MISLLTILATLTFAQHHHKHHTHGKVEMQFSYMEGTGIIELEAPMDVVWNAEHFPKSMSEAKDLRTKLVSTLVHINEAFQFPEELGCYFVMKNLEYEEESGHSELKTEYEVRCPNKRRLSADKAKVEVDLSKLSWNVSTMEATLNIAGKPTQVKLKKGKGTLQL